MYLIGNLRRALLILESCRVEQYPFTENQRVELPDWESYVTQLVEGILKSQNPAQLLTTRKMLYELLINCIPPSMIISTITKQLIPRLDDEMKHKIVHWAAFYVCYIFTFLILYIGTKPLLTNLLFYYIPGTSN